MNGFHCCCQCVVTVSDNLDLLSFCYTPQFAAGIVQGGKDGEMWNILLPVTDNSVVLRTTKFPNGISQV